MGVRIDEAWRDNEASSVDLALCFSSGTAADEDDAVAL